MNAGLVRGLCRQGGRTESSTHALSRPRSASEEDFEAQQGAGAQLPSRRRGTGVQPLPHPRVAPRGLSSEVLVGNRCLTRRWPELTGLRQVRHLPGRCMQPLRSKSSGEASSALARMQLAPSSLHDAVATAALDDAAGRCCSTAALGSCKGQQGAANCEAQA